MRRAADPDQPLVFISFARNDQATAARLREDLKRHDIDTFVYDHDIAPGGNIVDAVEQALTQSDYFVLLWSQAACDRGWVKLEWSAALMRDLDGHRLFLFVVRLDRTPVPRLLAARRYLDAFDDSWDSVVEELVDRWYRDWAVRRHGLHVLPAPDSAAAYGADVPRPAIELNILNRDLRVRHVLTAPQQSTGARLMEQVRAALALKDSVSEFDGTVGMHLSYQLRYAGEPLPPDRTLAEVGITDGTTIMLEVEREWFGPGESTTANTYRGGPPSDLGQATVRLLRSKAFGHLTPWKRGLDA